MREEHVYHDQFQNEGIFLATLMHEPSFLQDTVVTENHFTDSRHRAIFKIMVNLAASGVEPTYETLAMQDQQTLNRMGGFAHLAQVIATFLTTENFKHQQDQLLTFKAIEASRDTAEQFLNNTSDKNDMKAISQLLENLSNYETATVPEAMPFSQKVQERIQEHAESPTSGINGIDTGFYDLNAVTSGWQRKKLHIVAARPSVGKTAFALNAMRNSASKGVFSTLFSLETSYGDIIDRLLAAESRVKLRRIKNVNSLLAGDDEPFNAYTKAANDIQGASMDVRDDIFTIPEMRAAVRENIKHHPDMKHAVYVDYLTLMTPPNQKADRRDLEVDSITNGLKEIAKEFNIPVVCLSQLSRAVESRNDKRPTMADLRDSGGIEQIADLVAFLYREDYQEEQADTTSEVTFIIRKNRDGPTSAINFHFNKPFQEYAQAYG